MLKNQHLVSVIIPVFNGVPYLQEAVASVLASSYKKIEILLINDGSADKSKKICHQLEKRYAKVKFYNFNKNKGLGRVLNFALRKAKGQYICRLNQDDRMLSQRIQTQVKYLESHPKVVALGSSIELFTEQGQTQIVHFLSRDSQIRKLWHLISPFSDPSVMYRKETALAIGGYSQEFWPADDVHLWIRMGTIGRLANIDKPLVEVRYHAKAASVKYFKKITLVTYKLHRWMHQEIQPASVGVQLFWIGQLVAGLLLPPDLNWEVYRILKRVIYFFNRHLFLINKNITKPMLSRVMPQPAA